MNKYMKYFLLCVHRDCEKSKMSEVVTLVSDKLSMQLDCVGWNKKHNLLAIGAYMIDPSDSSKRIGKIFLFQLIENKDNIETHMLLQEISCGGVLDLRWEPSEENKLVVATASSVTMFELFETPPFKLDRLDTLELNTMALYAQWIDKTSLIYSDADGTVSIVTSSPLQRKKTVKIHDNLTWVVQYSPKHNIIFGGSDEGKFTGFLMDNIENEETHYTKKFEVGVTSILFFGENNLAVGSYDDTLRIFTIDCADPIVLSMKRKIDFGGALWRTISFPDATCTSDEKKFYIVAACARNGVHVVHLNCNDWTHKTVTTCTEFEGFLAYGLDAKLEQRNESQKITVASCYFDNHQLHMWQTCISAAV